MKIKKTICIWGMIFLTVITFGQNDGQINGRITNRGLIDYQRYFQVLKNKNPRSEKELNVALTEANKMLLPAAVIKVAVVTLEGEGQQRMTNANDQGFFRFDRLPPGIYRVSVTIPDCPTLKTGVTRNAYAARKVKVDSGRGEDIFLMPSILPVTMHGKVVDTAGHPLSGVTVTVEEKENDNQLYPPDYVCDKWTTKSGPDGRFQFRNLPPENIFAITALDNHSPRIIISATAPGYSMKSKGSMAISMFSAEIVELRTRMIQFYNPVLAAKGKPVIQMGLDQKSPQSKDNVIDGIVIIMEK